MITWVTERYLEEKREVAELVHGAGDGLVYPEKAYDVDSQKFGRSVGSVCNDSAQFELGGCEQGPDSWKRKARQEGVVRESA